VQQPQFDAVGRTSVQTAFDLLEPDGWKPGCGQQDDLARGAVVGIGVDRVAIHACELPDRTGEIGAVHVEKVLIKCLQILKSLDNFLTTELLRLLKRSEIS
jgi:hypothetical protein